MKEIDNAVNDILKHLKLNGRIDNGWNTCGNGYVYMMGWQLKKEYFEPEFIGLNQDEFDKFWRNINNNSIYVYFSPEREKGITKVSLREVKEHIKYYIKEQFECSESENYRDLWFRFTK